VIVANVRDAFASQTNIVRQDGRRGALVVRPQGRQTLSTIDVVKGIRAPASARRARTLPPETQDSASLRSVHFRPRLRERCHPRGHHRRVSHGIDDFVVFWGSWRSTLIIAISISAIHLDIRHDPQLPRRNHQHHDAWGIGPSPSAFSWMTPRFTIEKHRAVFRRRACPARCHPGKARAGKIAVSRPGIHALHLHRVPCRCFLLSGCGPATLFVPLAEAVVFAMLAFVYLVPDARAYAGDVSA